MYSFLNLCADIKANIASVEASIAVVEADIDYWQEYKDKGSEQHQLQIALLEQEKKDIEQTFSEIDGLLSCHIEYLTRLEIIRETLEVYYVHRYCSNYLNTFELL